MDEDLIVQSEGLNESSDDDDSDVPDDNFGSDQDSEELDDDNKEEENSNSEEEVEESDALVNVTNEGDDSNCDDDSDVSKGEDEANSSDGGNEASEEEEEGNVGWADAMSKVLAIGKNSDKTVSVLSKAKKDNVKQKKTKQNKENASDEESDEVEEKVLEPLAVRKARKKELDSIGRTRPDILQRNAEKALTRVATRGVVQLFNAVREQQKDIKTKLKEAGGSMRKQEKVYKNIDKNSFVDILTGGKSKVSDMTGAPASKKAKVEDDIKEEEDDKSSSWNILRDDFMLGAKMKDWDKDSDDGD